MKQKVFNKGFTLLELVIVLLLIAIGSALLMTRFQNNQARIRGVAETLKTHLRFTQSSSLGTSDVWYIDFIDQRQYQLFKKDLVNASADHAHAFPLEETSIVQLPQNVTLDIDATLPSHTVIAYDTYGRPASILSGSVIPTENRNIRIRDESVTLSITITAETGFIP